MCLKTEDDGKQYAIPPGVMHVVLIAVIFTPVEGDMILGGPISTTILSSFAV